MPRCQACDAEVLWAFTEKGRRIPLNADPDTGGNVQLLPSGVARVHAGPGVTLEADDTGVRYMPHHATCPNASEFKGPRRNASRGGRG